MSKETSNSKSGSPKSTDLQPPHYREAFYLQEQIGNNAFDYESRSQSHPSPQLRVAPLVQTENLDLLQPGREIAFEVFDEGKTKSFAGLNNFLQLQLPPVLNSRTNTHSNTSADSKPAQPRTSQANIYIFDNHNHAFYFWHLDRSKGKIHNQTTLIHIDQHKDSRIPIQYLSPTESANLDEVFRYTNEILNVGNFIPPSFQTGLIKEMLLVDSTDSLENFFLNNPHFNPDTNSKLPSFILDIDLDFFAPELDYIGNQKKLELIEKLLPHASTVTFATSPFFIDPNLAIQWCKTILAKFILSKE